MTQRYDFHCHGCGASVPQAPARFLCGVCGEPMSIRMLTSPDAGIFQRPPASMWAYVDLLPIEDPASIVTLEEGATPLVSAPRLADEFALGALWLKNETLNPTGSFKDRQVSVGISHARELGKETVAVVSSGNVACAAAAYAARAGMRAILFTHGHAAPSKMAQAAAYGATALQVDVPSAAAVFDVCREACAAFGWYHLSTAGMYEPFNVEGAKTIAYELYQQTGGDLPEWIVAPVGGGGLLGGVWRGLLDLKRLRLIERLPRLAGVQAAGCAPLKRAIEDNVAYLDTLKKPWPNPKTIAGGIADDILFDGHTVLPAIRETKGAAIAVTDEEILEGELRLAQTEGILCEPSAAVTIAALKHLDAPGARVCCLVTGTGIKDLAVLEGHVTRPTKIEGNLGAVRKMVR